MGWRTRNRDESGASLVEFALVLPVFMMLMLGMFTGGLAYNRRLAITQATREGARYGATLPIAGTTTPAWLDAVAAVVQKSGDGELDDTAVGTARVICVALINGGVANNRAVSGAVVTYNPTTCYDDGRPLTDARVQVVGSRSSKFEALLFSQNLTLKSQATARYEAG